MQKGKLHHISIATTISMLIDILHGQNTASIVGKVYFCLDPLLGALTTITDRDDDDDASFRCKLRAIFL